jgi:polyphosphate kinase
MPRNLNRRVEVLYPVESPKLIRRLRNEILQRYLDDQAGSWLMAANGSFTRAPQQSGMTPFSSQGWFMEHHGG